MDNLSIVFTLLCIGYSVYEIKRALSDRKANVAGNQSQNVISVGVLFTFVGIAISLMYFDTNPNTMAKSIEIFLDGMKTAFYSSIVGMLAAIIIKYIQAGVELKEDKAYRESLDDIKYMNKNILDMNKNLMAVVAELHEVKLTTDFNTTSGVENVFKLCEQIKILNSELKDFIGAYNITQVKIDDRVQQYGESFKQLNNSVQAINKWQSEYKNIVDESIKELNLIQNNFVAFQEVISRDLSDNIMSLDENLNSFAKTTKLNVEIQDSLHESTAKLTEMVALYRASILSMQKVLDKIEADKSK